MSDLSPPAPQPWRASVDGREAVAVAGAALDLVRLPDGRLSYVDPSGRSILVEVEDVDLRAYRVTLRLDGRRHVVALQTPLMQLIDELGLEADPAPTLSEVHAPMPGLVLRVAVAPGATVAAGDTLLVLEAMKMENAIKAPADATVTEVAVAEGQAVERGALLVKF